MMDDETVAAFVGSYTPAYALLDIEHPVSHGNFAGLGGPYFEFKHSQRLATERARGVVKSVGAEWAAISGRPFGMIETFGMDDAEVAVVVLGSTAGNARHVARELRAKGAKVGVVKVRCFRPFPHAELAEALAGVRAVAVMDRSESFGAEGGPVFLEVRSALYDLEERVPVVDYVYGLGGSDVKTELIERVFTDLSDIASGQAAPFGPVYLGAR
jgi:pyruvate ferredoxin oxidoreductase alpha subunit